MANISRRVASSPLLRLGTGCGVALAATFAAIVTLRAAGEVSLTALDSTYTQYFDTLVASGTSSTIPAGWYFLEGGANANSTYTAGTGSSTAGDTYSFGATDSPERAFGGLLSGNLNPTIGAKFVNSTGTTITSVDVSYAGELWRSGNTNRSDRLDFQYSTNATDLATGTWINVDALDYTSPGQTATGAKDGNTLRQTVSASITGLNIPAGGTLWLRWADFDVAPGADDGIGVDDFSLTPRGSGPVQTSPTGTGSASPNPIGSGSQTTLSATVTPGTNPASTGLQVTCDLSALGGSSTFSLAAQGGNVYSAPFAVPGNTAPQTYAITCTVSDDLPRTTTFPISLTVTGAFLCDAPGATLISAIQGTGNSSPFAGQTVTIQGIVVGDFQGTVRDSVNDAQLQGFFVQEEASDQDSNPATSEGILVFQGNQAGSAPVAVGDQVRVRGTVVEFGTQVTELNQLTNLAVCSSGNALAYTPVTLPIDPASSLERYEGMAIEFPQTLTVTETFNLGSFGEVVLASGRLANPTNVVEPGAPAIALQQLNDRSRIILDDGSNLSRQNFDPPSRLFPQDNPATPAVDPGLSALNTLRVGSTVGSSAAPLRGILDHAFGAYRIHPTSSVSFNHVNPRANAPSAVGGTLRVASFNVLNYFTTLDAGNPACGPTGGMDCRGANSALEFQRQRAKIVGALAALNADIVGLIELENNASDSALQDLVNGLNAIPGGSQYEFIHTGVIGGDAIKVGLIYQPARVLPLGNEAVLTSANDPRTLDNLNRPPLAQTFQRLGPKGELQKFTVVVNHFKSKGSACGSGDPDAGDGQGNCNLTRVSIANALRDWLATDPTGSGDPDFLIIGDLNSYVKEDPIDVLTAANYVNQIPRFGGPEAYSYVFQGQSGSLDHALASRSLNPQVVGAVDWHINADEPVALDYNQEWTTGNNPILKNGNQWSLNFAVPSVLYNPDPFRAADHDPLLLGVNLLCGDLDDDADVDMNDYAVFRARLNTTNIRADYDGDGRVTQRDYALWYLCYRNFTQVGGVQ